MLETVYKNVCTKRTLKYASMLALGSLISVVSSFVFVKYLKGKTTKQMLLDIQFKREQTKYRSMMDYKFSFTTSPKLRPSTECIAYDAMMRKARQDNIPDTSTRSKALNAVKSIRKAMNNWGSMIHYPSFIPSPKKLTIHKNINNHQLNGYLLSYPGCSLENGIIMYFFGGGFFSGNIRDGYPMLNIMQQYLGCYGFVVDYGLAPEVSLPKIINEAIESYKYVLNTLKVNSHKIFVVGDSSGGAMSLLLLQKLNTLNLPQPCGGIILSPIVDLSWKIAINTQIVGKKNGITYTFDAIQIRNLYFASLIDDNDRKEYNNDEDKIMSLATYSPLNGNWKGLCPLYVNASLKELLINDAKAVVNKCKQFEIDVTYVWDQCLPHSTALRCDMIPECRDRLIIIIQWMKNKWMKNK